MSKAEKIAAFNPSGIGLENGHFIGLPFSEEDAEIVLLPVPWDLTVSFTDGTASGAQNILDCSTQLDLFDADVKDAWKIGIYMRHMDLFWTNRNKELRSSSKSYIHFIEKGGNLGNSLRMLAVLKIVNESCLKLNNWVYEQTKQLLTEGKKVGIVGGEHSVPLGFLQALAERYDQFGVLQIDAHMDLRKAYEGFTYSHASIFYNALQIPEIVKLVQAGIRDYCEEEVQLAGNSNGRVKVFYDQQIKELLFRGDTFHKIAEYIIADLPEQVYVSFDIDGLVPDLCPNTGTPVPGGLQYWEAIYLLKMLVESGREIIGFDLCEVAGVGHEWDGNVGARVLYKMCNLMGKR